MKNVKNNKQKQINDIVSVVKISILLLIGIILFQNFINNNLTVWVPEMYYTVICLFIPLMVSVLIYLIWIFSTKYRFNKRYVDIINKIEIAVFIIVFR